MTSTDPSFFQPHLDDPAAQPSPTLAGRGFVPIGRHGSGHRLRDLRARLGARIRTAMRCAGLSGVFRPGAFRPGAFRIGAGIDSFLLLAAICTMILPTTPGYELTQAAAGHPLGAPFALMMYLSPFFLMAILPLRVLWLVLDGLFGIRLRTRILAPMALLSLTMFLLMGPLAIRPAPQAAAMPAAPVAQPS